MKKTLITLIALLYLPLSFVSCEKDKLIGIYDQFEGKFEWTHSTYGYRDYPLGPLLSHTDSATEANYTAQIQFDNTGRVTFFINDSILTKKKFIIKDQYEDSGLLYMDLRVDVNKKVLDIDDRLEVYSKSNDTIYLSGFPGDGYDTDFQGTNYFVRIE